MIRELTQEDDLKTLLDEWVEECRGKDFEINCDVDITLGHLKAMVGQENTTVFVITDGRVLGVIGVQVVNSPIGKDLLANEHLWYVSKGYRGMNSVRLLMAAMDWARERGCSHFMATASMLASDLHDTICDLYKTIGMKRFETTYISLL